jgi:hypothetical protein
MSAIDTLRLFAESREDDIVLIQSGFSYGDCRKILAVLSVRDAEIKVLREVLSEITDQMDYFLLGNRTKDDFRTDKEHDMEIKNVIKRARAALESISTRC